MINLATMRFLIRDLSTNQDVYGAPVSGDHSCFTTSRVAWSQHHASLQIGEYMDGACGNERYRCIRLD